MNDAEKIRRDDVSHRFIGPFNRSTCVAFRQAWYARIETDIKGKLVSPSIFNIGYRECLIIGRGQCITRELKIYGLDKDPRPEEAIAGTRIRPLVTVATSTRSTR